ncbi:MAG: hypothetical protein IJN88_03035, partial [Clostridia bacterium]|nr:hypothetical protein [Clostridia bacterium]
MKVGKKVLSTLLAIIMIVSSVSVCFSVLGAESSVKMLITRIEQHYATLADYILAAKADGATADDLKKVPKSRTVGQWEVELDSSTSSWHWVTSAYAAVAEGYADGTKSIKEINDAIKDDVSNYADKALDVDKYNEVLDYFAFGDASVTTTLYIGEGFDILQWAPDYTQIPESADDLQLYSATATFTVDSATGKVSEVKFENAQQDSAALAGNMAMVKEAIADFITKADTWFNTDYSALDVDILNETVKGISEDIVTYELAVTVGNYEEVWDAYVAPAITGNRKWAEVKQWYKTNIVGYIADAYAAQYKDAIDAIFATAETQTAGADLLESYKLIQAELDKLNEQTAYNGDETVNITDMIIEAMPRTAYNKILEDHQKLGYRVAEAFANEQFKDFIDLYVQVVDTDNQDPVVITSSAAKAMGHVWEETCSATPCTELCPASGKVTVGDDGVVVPYTYTVQDENGNEVEYTCTVTEAHCVHYHYNLAYDFYFGTDDKAGAADVVAVFEQNVLPYITNAAGVIEWGYLQDVGKDLEGKDPNFVTLNERNWTVFTNAVGVVNLDVNGATYKEYKAQMDAYMDAAILTGSMTYAQISGMVNDMLAMGYKSCKELSTNVGTKDLFEKIFGKAEDGEGMVPYDEFINDLKRRAVNRIYDLVDQVYYYYDEGDGTMDNNKGVVAYHNFEAILGAYSAVSGEALPGVLLKFLNAAPVYNPGAEQFAEKVAEDADYVRTFDAVSAYYDSVTTDQDGQISVVAQAEAYRDMLKQLRDSEGGALADNVIRDKLFDRYKDGRNYTDATMYEYLWQSKTGTLDYGFVQEILDAVGVVTTQGARDLLAGAVDAIDKMLISEDMGSLLGALLRGEKHKTKVNKTTGITKYGYVGSTNADGTGTKKIFWISDAENANAANLDGTTMQGYTLKAMTNSLGYWEYAYAYDHDGDPNTAKFTPTVGSECKNLKEWLVSTIISYLFSGELHTMLFKLLNEMVGPMIYDMAGRMGEMKAIGITLLAEDDNSYYFPTFLRCALATMPHLYTANSDYTTHDGVKYDFGQTGVHFYKWFNGDFWGDEWDYSKVLELCSKAGWDTKADKYTRTYWNEKPLANYSRGRTEPYGITPEEWASFDSNAAWHIDSFDDFYRALASATCGYQPILSGLLTSDESYYALKVDVLGDLTGDIKFWASEDNIYDNILVPLFEVLGIENYVSTDQIKADGKVTGESGSTMILSNYGLDLWTHLLSPLVTWIETELFANPVETILNILPNLVAALEYNQIFPKIQNIVLQYYYEVKVLGIKAASGGGIMNLSKDTILPLLKGIELKKGFTGLLESLSKITKGTPANAPPKNDDGTDNLTGYLTTADKNAKGETLYYDYNNGSYTNPTTENPDGTKVTKTVAYRDKDGNYYFATGMLSQTLFGLFGERVFDGYTKKGNDYSLSLTIPVNRLMAMCTMADGYPKTVPVVKETLTIYHLKAAPADVLLVLLRWLMNDGVLTTVGKLLGAEGILGTVLGALTGQADNIAGILVSLLNEYNVDLYPYVNAYATTLDNDASNDKMSWANKDLGVDSFVLGEYLTESTGYAYEGATGVDKINAAIKNVDDLIPALIPTLLDLLGDTLDGFLGKPLNLLGQEIDLGFVQTALDNIEKGDTLADIVADIIASDELMQIVAELLFNPTTAIDEETGDEVEKPGLLPGILGGEMVAKLLPALADFGFDVSPNGFYKMVSGNFYNPGLAAWLKSCGADKADCTWDKITAPADGFNWYQGKTLNTNEQKVDAFFRVITDLIAPLNPIFSLILCGEDLTYFDELTLEGGNGYSTGLVMILEALGVGDVQIPGTNNTYYKASMSKTTYLEYVFGNSDPTTNQGSNRNWPSVNSPLDPLFVGLRALLVGDDTAKVTGILESPLTAILELLPRVAYFMYTYDTDEKDESGAPIRTSNLAQSVKNLIGPVLKILDIIDPVLSKILELDVAQLISDFLDLETTINTAISKAVAKEGLTDAQINISSFIDFGALAVCGGNMTVYTTNADTGTLPGNIDVFYYSDGVAGQAFVTLVRSILTEDMLKLFSRIYENFIASGGIDGTAPEPEEVVRLTNIANGLVDRCKTPNLDANGKYNGTAVDIIVGILVDLLTDYEPGTGIPMFYTNLGKALDDAIDNADAIIDKYGLEHEGYDWESITKDENGNVLFTKEEVNETMDSLDIVISKALPDILGILVGTGTLDLSKLGVELDTSTGLFDIVAGLLGDLVFNDKMMTTIYDALMGIFGGGIGNFRDLAKEAGFDITAKTLYLSNDTGAALKDYMSYNLTIDANGQVNGEDLAWNMIKDAHSIQAYEYDENGNVVIEDGAVKLAETEDGKPVYDSTVSYYNQKKDADGKYIYTYTNANGEAVEYTSELSNLKSFAVKTGTKEVENEDGETETVDVYTKYALTPVYDETSQNTDITWTFGFQEGNTNFYNNLGIFVSSLWDFIAQLEDILIALFFGEDTNTAVKAFDTLNIEGQDTYENTILPLLRGFGLDAILSYLDTNYVLDENGDATTTTYLAALNAKRGEKYGTTAIPNRLIKHNEGMKQAMGGEYDMEKFLQIVVNYVFYFVEILAEYPIATLANMLPTLAYFIVGDGLNEVVSNLLTFIMVFIERLGPVLSVNVNDLGAGLIDYLGTNTWTTFQEIFKFYEGKDGNKYYDEISYDEDGNIIRTPVPAEQAEISLTEALVSFLANIKIDMAGIYKYDQPYYRTITTFIDAEAENTAWDIINANTDEDGVTDPVKLEEARQLRSDALIEFFTSLAALADPFGASYTDAGGETHNIAGEYQNLVKIDAVNGQLTVSKADVLMFILDFVFANTTLKEVLGSVLGYDITDENGTDAALLDNILTGVFRNPDEVVDLIVTLFTDYTVAGTENVQLKAIEEYHYDFYDDAGLTYDDITADGYEGSIIARTKTSYAIDNLDKLVGTVLNLFKAELTKEGALLDGIVSADADLTLTNLVNTLLEEYLFTDDIINDLLGMLVGLLASDSVDNILGIVADILD